MMADTATILTFFVAGLVIGVGLTVLFGWLVERRALSMRNQVAGKKGIEARQSREEELFQAIAEAMQLMKDGTPPVDALKAVAANHPAVAARIVSKILKGELPAGLGDLNG